MPRYKKFDLPRIAQATGMTTAQMRHSRVNVEILKDIYQDYAANQKLMGEYQEEIVKKLNKCVMPHCHSIRSRIKDVDHLIAKIVRNADAKGGKYLTIDRENYLHRVNDLIGIRIIVLRQKDSRAVHEAILSLYENDPQKYASAGDYDANISAFTGEYIAEKPVVYVTSESDKRFYENIDGLEITTSKRTYRSIHYIVRHEDIYFEIQVRTLFEEGWLEIDHSIKYPNDLENPKKLKFLKVLNGLASAADDLISFYDTIEPYMNAKNKKKGSINDQKRNKNLEDQEDTTKRKTVQEKVLDKF